MPFVKPNKRKESKPRGNLNRFVRLDEGKNVIIQILEDIPTDYWKYWFRDSAGSWVSYVSPGFNNDPIAERNRLVGKESKSYIKAQHSYAINVLDLTPMIKCGKCANAYWPKELVIAQDSGISCECGESLTGVLPEPLGMIRILERGRRLFLAIAALCHPQDEDDFSTPVLLTPGPDGQAVKLTNVPLMIVRTGEGSDTVTSPAAQLHLLHQVVNPDDIQEELHSLPSSFDFTPEEILAMIDDGVTCSDILSARKADREASQISASNTAVVSTVPNNEALF